MKDIREMLAFASAFAELAVNQFGELFPIWHCVTRDGDHFITPSPSPDKETSASMMRAIFELRDVVRYIYMNEAWIIEAGTEEESEKLLDWIREHDAADHPNAIEVVAFMGEDFEGGSITARRLIQRNGKPRLGPLVVDDLSGVQSEGRLIGMLPRRNATVQ